MRDQSGEPDADQVIVNRIQTLRALRMVRAHIVQPTGGVRDIRDGHGEMWTELEMTLRALKRRESGAAFGLPGDEASVSRRPER
jgi:hypothetical protein